MQPQRIPIHANKVLAAILLFLAVLLALPALAVNNNIDETQTFALESITDIRVSASSTRVSISRARTSPYCSNSRVLPQISANSTVAATCWCAAPRSVSPAIRLPSFSFISCPPACRNRVRQR